MVLDAACYLLQSGCTNVPDTSSINIKQGLAVLQAAAWLQKKVGEWMRDGKLTKYDAAVLARHARYEDDELLMILSGAAGTGKTTVVRIIDKLMKHFYHPEALAKSAPTNTAARMLGGDTCAALYKLPLKSLKGKRGKLKGKVLTVHRRRRRAG